MGPIQTAKTYVYFVYRTGPGNPFDVRCPRGGVSVQAWTDCAALDQAVRKALRRYPCKPLEQLHLRELKHRIEIKQARLMEADWERAYRDFESLMTVS